MKKTYMTPETEVIRWDSPEVIVTSGDELPTMPMTMSLDDNLE